MCDYSGARITLLIATAVGILWNVIGLIVFPVVYISFYYHVDAVAIVCWVLCFILAIVYGLGLYGAIKENWKILKMFAITVSVVELIYVILLIVWMATWGGVIVYGVISIVFTFLFVFLCLYCAFVMIKSLS